MSLSSRVILWSVFALQIIVFLLTLWLVAFPLAKRSATDLAGLMVMSAKTWESLSPERRNHFAETLQEDTGLILERGLLPHLPHSWKPHWYADWIQEALHNQGIFPSQINMQQEMVEVLLLIQEEPLILRASSPSLGKVFIIFLLVSLLAMAGTLLALWWQKRWQLQMWRHQLILSGLAHDFRTPLTRLKLQLAVASGMSSDQANLMNDQVNALANMIDMTLALSTQQQATVQTKLLAELWQQWKQVYPDVYFNADEVLLNQVASRLLERIVQNLIDNALVHGRGQVQVMLSQGKKGWLVSVEDEGAGIPDKVWKAIEKDQPPEAKGVGLGLLSSRWLAKLSGLQLQRTAHGVVISR
jgi:two-component system osmolarity sensor histidine kinase EnvZ